MEIKNETPDGIELGERSRALKLKIVKLQSEEEAEAMAPELLLEALKLIEGYEQAFISIQRAMLNDPNISCVVNLKTH